MLSFDGRQITGEDSMIISKRIALLAGASIAAVSVASPALSAPYYPSPAPHDSVPNGTYAGTNHTVAIAPFTDNITLCNIATTADCFFGEKDEGNGVRNANVSTVVDGQVQQEATGATGPVVFNISNDLGDFAEFGAVALATSGAVATASAHLNTAISQNADGWTRSRSTSLTMERFLLIRLPLRQAQMLTRMLISIRRSTSLALRPATMSRCH